MTTCNYVPNDSAHMRFDPGNAERLLGNALLRWQPTREKSSRKIMGAWILFQCSKGRPDGRRSQDILIAFVQAVLMLTSCDTLTT